MTVRMELSRILIRELNDCQIIELREAEGAEDDQRRAFPIVIGLPEAQAFHQRISPAMSSATSISPDRISERTGEWSVCGSFTASSSLPPHRRTLPSRPLRYQPR